ncbi:MAG TPA: hypothetical protein VE398_07815 [Acidobacteriota bacterium]|nr:hypothetical protein [Acidobacteriota bacterium]
MKKVLPLLSAFVFSFLSQSFAAGQLSEFAGVWEVALNTPMGPRSFKAVLRQDGEKLACVLKRESGDLPCNASVTDKQIKIAYTIAIGSTEISVALTGLLNEGAIKGEADFGGDAKGDWTAKRAPADGPVSSGAVPGNSGEINITGTWLFQVETPMGTGSPTFTFTQKGQKLTGHYTGILGEADVTGTVRGNAVTFSFEVESQGVKGTVTYAGTVEKDIMKGTARLADVTEGTFTARRE